jgi:ribose transport system permease protein
MTMAGQSGDSDPGAASLDDVADLRDSSGWRRLLRTQELWITVAVLVIGLVVSQLSPHFATLSNLGNVLQNFCFIGLLAIGMTPVIASGGIDISIGSVLGLCGVTLGVLLEAETPLWLGIVATLAVGLAAGALNGYLIAYLRLSPFVVTLGTLSAYRSLAIVVTSNQAVFSFGHAESAILAIGGGKTFGIANVFYALLAAGVVLHFLLTMSRWGRYVLAIGGNEHATRLTGIPVRRIKLSVYAFAGLMAGITGIFLIGWLGSVTNSLGQGDELRVIAATVIGGASLAGGAGTAFGAAIGSLLIEEIRNALLLAGVDPFWQGLFVGLFIVLAVLLQRLQTSQEED